MGSPVLYLQESGPEAITVQSVAGVSREEEGSTKPAELLRHSQGEASAPCCSMTSCYSARLSR